MEAQRQFDADYRIVRKLILTGKYGVDAAKHWIKKHGVDAAIDLQLEIRDRNNRQAGQRPDREIERIKAYETKEYGDLKDDV